MTGNRSQKGASLVILFFMVLDVSFESCFSAASQPPSIEKSTQRISAKHRLASSAVFRVNGNVYPLGYYSVVMNIGNPPKAYDFDIDTGSDLTWLQCDAPCKGCTKPSDQLYKPKNNIVPCSDPLCHAIQAPEKYHCVNPNEQCDYEVEYADYGSSLGVLLMDYFSLMLSNGSLLKPRIAFGCGYDQHNPGPHPPLPTSGILGLGRGKASIVSQLQATGIMQNVIGHCLSRLGGGFLFFGDDLLNSSGTTWAPMTHSSLDTHYSSGPAELTFGGKPTGVTGLELVFDSGSSYTYFNAQVYESTVNLIKNDLTETPLKDAPEDKTLPICWKGSKPVKSIHDITNYFRPLALSFTNAKNVELQLTPEDYLIVSKDGNVCLGILNGSQLGLGNLNVIGGKRLQNHKSDERKLFNFKFYYLFPFHFAFPGLNLISLISCYSDIFFQEKMVIYDNEKQRIGWFSTNCDTLPTFINGADRQYTEGFCQNHPANFGMTEGYCRSTFASETIKKMAGRETPKTKRQRWL